MARGSLSFYGPAESSLGVAGDWDNYSATVTGNVSITITTDGLTAQRHGAAGRNVHDHDQLGHLLGSGQTTSPNFAGSVVDHGDRRHGRTRARQRDRHCRRQRRSHPTTALRSTATPARSASRPMAAAPTRLPSAATRPIVLQVSASPPRSRPIKIRRPRSPANINTSLADTYNLTAKAPAGWTVTIDDSGNVTVTPAPGVQGGTYPIQIIAQSSTDPNLVANAHGQCDDHAHVAGHDAGRQSRPGVYRAVQRRAGAHGLSSRDPQQRDRRPTPTT